VEKQPRPDINLVKVKALGAVFEHIGRVANRFTQERPLFDSLIVAFAILGRQNLGRFHEATLCNVHCEIYSNYNLAVADLNACSIVVTG